MHARPPSAAILTPLAVSSMVWLAPTGVRGGLTAAMGQHTVDLRFLVLSWLGLVVSSSCGFAVCCAHCLPAARTHAHTDTRSLTVPAMLTGA